MSAPEFELDGLFFVVAWNGYRAVLPACICERTPCTRGPQHTGVAKCEKTHCHAVFGKHNEHVEKFCADLVKGKTAKGYVWAVSYNDPARKTRLGEYVDCYWPSAELAYESNKDAWDEWAQASDAALSELKTK